MVATREAFLYSSCHLALQEVRKAMSPEDRGVLSTYIWQLFQAKQVGTRVCYHQAD